jgi:chromosome segregation ATPase
MRRQNAAPKSGNARRRRASDTQQTDVSSAMNYQGRFSSVASLQTALNLNRKEAFDDETHMMESTTADDNATFLTSTTDYLRSASVANKSRNLGASFDSADSRHNEPTPLVGSLSLFSQDTSNNIDAGIKARERKRLQEREWQHDRQRKESAEPNDPGKFTPKIKGLHHAYHKSADFSDDDSHWIEDGLGPHSSRQLGTGVDAPTTGRNGYDSDSYSLRALNKVRYKTARPSPKRGFQQQSFLLDDQKQPSKRDSYVLDEKIHRQPTTISKILSGGAGGGDEHNSSFYNDSNVELHPPDRVNRDANSESSFLAESATKIKMTKMEKIKQLHTKNDRYKEEYKKTYLEKKEFKKKYEDKKVEVASLTMEIDSYMRETALLKKQLSKLTREADKSEDNVRQDVVLVASLQKELKQTRADLKEALARITERKMESTQLKESMKRKDDQIESLTLEVSRQIEEVQHLQAQICVQDMSSAASSQAAPEDNWESLKSLEKLRKENDNLKGELAMTLDRAAEMVKNREGTIEILRRENIELKELMDIRDQDDNRSTKSEKIQRKEVVIEQLKTELSGLRELLENSMGDRENLKATIREREAEVKNLKLDIDGLKTMVKRAEKEAHKSRQEVDSRDDKIRSLNVEVKRLAKKGKDAQQQIEDVSIAVGERDLKIQEMMNEMESLMKQNQNATSVTLCKTQSYQDEKDKEVKELYRENENLKAEMLQQREQLDERRKRVVLELEETRVREKELQDELQESAAMVKQREDAIEDLLKDVEKLKEGRETKENEISQELGKQEQSILSMMKDMEHMRRQLTDKGQELEHTRAMVKEREVAIEDLLRDIEKLKQEGSGSDQKGADQAEKFEREIDDRNDEIDTLRGEVEELRNRLNQAHYDLRAKSEVLQERDESIEDLLQDMNDLKRQLELEHQQKQGDLMSNCDEKEALQRELKAANDLVQDKENRLHHLVRENDELKRSLEALRIKKESLEKEIKDDQSEEGDTKSYLIAQHEVLEEEIQQLNEQVGGLQAELEDANRQNSIMNEEVEDWLQRGGNMELEIQRLKNEIEAWEDIAEQLKASGGMRKGGPDDNASNSDGVDQQAMMLAKAISERKRKASADGKGVWGLFFNKSEEGEELTEDQKRIKELEAIKDAQAEEIQKTKSDLVKLTTASKDEAYKTKKRMAELEEANESYKAKVDLLLRRLAEVQGVPYDIDDEKKTNDSDNTIIFPTNLL